MFIFRYKKSTTEDYYPVINFTVSFKNKFSATSALLVSLNLLGRAGFFEKFKITFEEKKKILRLE